MSNEKDISEKLLLEAEDVFADILNVLLFGGKQVILPHTLAPTGQRSQMKIGKAIHEQERDVAKLWTVHGIRFAMFGLENQTEMEADMALRVFSYDGASYKELAIHNRNLKKGEDKRPPYPVVTIVLYFGKYHWTGPRTLKEYLGSHIPPELEPFVNDYKLHIFEISFLRPETVAMFQSDFRIVADFFVQTRQNKDYVPSRETITHVEETLKLMSVLTGDHRFEEYYNEVLAEGGPVTMCEVLDRAENRGMRKGLTKGQAEGLAKGKAEGLAKGKAEGLAKGKAEGLEKGKAEGRLNTLLELVLDGMLPLAEAAARAHLSEQEFSQKAAEYKQSADSNPLRQ